MATDGGVPELDAGHGDGGPGPVAPSPLALPVIEGAPTPGSVLQVNRGEWTGDGNLFTYTWWRCSLADVCVKRTSASGPRYEVRGEDLDHALFVDVAVKNAAGSATATTERTARVRRSVGAHLETLEGFESIDFMPHENSGLYLQPYGAEVEPGPHGMAFVGTEDTPFAAGIWAKHAVVRFDVKAEVPQSDRNCIASFITEKQVKLSLVVRPDGKAVWLVGDQQAGTPVDWNDGWLLLEAHLNLASSPWSIDWRLQAEPMGRVVVQGLAASEIVAMSLGGCDHDKDAKLPRRWDNLAISTRPVDYPIGAGHVVTIPVAGDGVHQPMTAQGTPAFSVPAGPVSAAQGPAVYAELSMHPFDETRWVTQDVVDAEAYVAVRFDDPALSPDEVVNGIRPYMVVRGPYGSRGSWEVRRKDGALLQKGWSMDGWFGNELEGPAGVLPSSDSSHTMADVRGVELRYGLTPAQTTTGGHSLLGVWMDLDLARR